jgi:alkanesulfonate monooxygenase SsuD/methylene tetrahydromethanopterin reductase-like flavin-dependent oxidoreductase (luciferase family)
VLKVEEGDEPDFPRIQAEQVTAYRAKHPAGRVSQGLVVIPTDSATADQRRRYEEYAAKRLPRTREPQGPGRLLFSPDHVGTSEEIAEKLETHAGYQQVDEVAFALPFSFEPDDYVQLLTDIAERLGPALGWSPAS